MTTSIHFSSNLKKFLKISKNISLTLGFALSSVFASSLKAEELETPPLCKDVLGTLDEGTGAYSATAAQIKDGNMTFCSATPDRFQLDIHEMGLCTENPIIGTPKTFSKDNCVVSMTSTDGVTADLAGTTVDLPSAVTRPANGTYTYAYIVIKNTFGLRGSLKINDGAGGVHQYCSTSDGTSTEPAASCTPANHTETLSSFGDTYTPDFGPAELPTGGEVSAILTNSSLVRAGEEGSVERLIGVFATNAGTPVVINDSVNGLECELQVTDGGYGIEFSDATGRPIDFGSMPFKPVFNTF